ncbi:MAG TPA: ketopantoate reductase family protein [Euryarchaeota archaeon]|nr:ketopantoate reductase family protein [Euryarchaeota archaeon]
MRFLIVGTGALGGYFGGMMARGGLDVIFVSRGETLEVLQKNGLTVKTDEEEFTIPINVHQQPPGKYDVVFVTVKSHHTASILPLVKNATGQGALIITLQNGIANEELLSKELKDRRVLAGTAYIAADMDKPGYVVQTTLAQMVFGDLDGTVSGEAKEVARVLQKAKVDARTTPDIMLRKWNKMVWNCAFNSVTALTGLGTGEAARDEHASSIIRKAMTEVIAVARAEGIPVDVDIEKSLESSSRFSNTKTSMLQDIERGRPMEYEALNGEILRLGKKHGLEVPVNETLYTLLSCKKGAKAPWEGISAGIST